MDWCESPGAGIEIGGHLYLGSVDSATFEDWTQNRHISNYGTNAGATILAFQSWRWIKEAFVPELVATAVSETPGLVRHVVDPFGGSGTTALAAQFLGVTPTTIEVNPFLADLIEAKLAPLDVNRASAELRRVVESVTAFKGVQEPEFPGAPRTFVEPGYGDRWIFSKAVAGRLTAYRRAIDAVENESIQRVFRVILASVAIPVSNVVVSGKGRRYRKGWASREVPVSLVDELFCVGVAKALHDLRRFRDRKCTDYRVIRGDARTQVREIDECDLAVFSPPYPNSFDYTDIYNIELWTLGYLRGSTANKELRHSTIRSHVQIKRDLKFRVNGSHTLAEVLGHLEEVRSTLWDKTIPDMVGAYFEDMSQILLGLSQQLRSTGRVYIVVGDSSYASILIPSAKILAELAPSAGLELDRVNRFRQMQSSPQQGKKVALSESLLVLTKP